MAGNQFLGSAGVEPWRIQALARHFSSATLRYLKDSHVHARPEIFYDTVNQKSIADLKSELKGLTKEVATLKVSSESKSSWPPPAKVNDINPFSGEAPPGLNFVHSIRSNAKLHIVDSSSRGWTYCDWAFSAVSSSKFKFLSAR